MLASPIVGAFVIAAVAATLRGGSHTASTLYKSHLFVYAIRDKLSIYTYATGCLAFQRTKKNFKKFGECSSWDRRKRIIHSGAHSLARTTCIYGFCCCTAHNVSDYHDLCAPMKLTMTGMRRVEKCINKRAEREAQHRQPSRPNIEKKTLERQLSIWICLLSCDVWCAAAGGEPKNTHAKQQRITSCCPFFCTDSLAMVAGTFTQQPTRTHINSVFNKNVCRGSSSGDGGDGDGNSTKSTTKRKSEWNVFVLCIFRKDKWPSIYLDESWCSLFVNAESWCLCVCN